MRLDGDLRASQLADTLLKRELFLEVHPTQSDVDEIETSGKPSTLVVPNVETMVLDIAKGAADRVDWYKVGLTARQRTGVPVQITQPARRTLN